MSYRSGPCNQSRCLWSGEFWRRRDVDVHELPSMSDAPDPPPLMPGWNLPRQRRESFPDAGLALQGSRSVRGLRGRCAAFFGRDRDSQVVAANLMASRVNVSSSGRRAWGKTSLLRAGVAYRLRRESGVDIRFTPPDRRIRGCARDLCLEPEASCISCSTNLKSSSSTTKAIVSSLRSLRRRSVDRILRVNVLIGIRRTRSLHSTRSGRSSEPPLEQAEAGEPGSCRWGGS